MLREIAGPYTFQREGDRERVSLELIALDQVITAADEENTFLVNL